MTCDPANCTPEAGVLRDYLDYWSPTTDAPVIYHLAAGLVVLAGTVENRVYLQFGGDRIHPNVWALILGPSSFYRKSSSLNKARKVLMNLHDGQGPSPLLPDEFSREALLKRLSERGQGVLTYSEFSGALAQFGRDYMSGTVQLLADLYDAPPVYTRIVGPQTWTIQNPCLSILAASQTDWFIEKVKASDMRGGFLARFTFWPAFSKGEFLPMPPPPDPELGRRLLARLKRLRRLQGQMLLSPEATARYGQWVRRHEAELEGVPNVGDLSPFWSRLSITTLKFAMLLEMSYRETLLVGLEAVEQAVQITELLKRSLKNLFLQEFAFTQPMKDRQKLLRLVSNRPGISRRELLRASNLLARAFDDVLNTLVQEGSVVKEGAGLYPCREVNALSAPSAPVRTRPADIVGGTFPRLK